MRKKINQSGRSMIEMLGVLAIIGVLSVGGIAGYSKAMQKYRTNKTIDMVTQLANGIRTLYSGQRNYKGLSRSVLIKAKIISGFYNDSSLIGNNPYAIDASNPFGGTILVRDLWGSGESFTIAVDNIPQDACIEILAQDWGDASGTISFGKATIGLSDGDGHNNGSRTSCSSNDFSQCAKDGPMTVDKAIGICSSSSNTIGWLFY